MPLPKVSTPTFDVVLPSNGKKIKYRPFLVREEKILIMALESEDMKQITNAVVQILSACILTRGVKVQKLATFDIEYLFLNIRSKSVGESITVNVTCPDDEKTSVEMSIDLETIKVKKNNITYAETPTKFEAGTMQTAEVVAFGESIKLLEKIGLKKIKDHEDKVLNYGLEMLNKDNSINLVGTPKNKASVISFTLKGIHPHDIATILDDDGVAIRAGHHCCQILHEKLGLAQHERYPTYNHAYHNRDTAISSHIS